MVDQLLDAVAGRDAFDLVAALAYPLPAIVVLEFLEAPPADMDHFRRWAMDINGLFLPAAAVFGRKRWPLPSPAWWRCAPISTTLIAERVRQPRDDVISLLAAGATRDRLDMAELVSTCVTLFVAGHETTTNLIGNGMVALLRHPGALAQVRGLWSHGAGHRGDAALRCAGRARLAAGPRRRRTRRPAIRQGQMVLLMLGAANRDGPVRRSGDIRRDPHREPAPGLWLRYPLLPGAPLARIEAPIAIGTLLGASRPWRWMRAGRCAGATILPCAASRRCPLPQEESPMSDTTLTIGLVSIARPTFDVPLAQSIADGVADRLEAAGCTLTGSGRTLIMDTAALTAVQDALAAPPDLLLLLQASFADSSMAVLWPRRPYAHNVPVLLWAVPDARGRASAPQQPVRHQPGRPR